MKPGAEPHQAVIRHAARGEWLHFTQPQQVITAWELGQVLPALQQIEDQVEAKGLWAAGFISYEAAPAFDPVLPVRPMAGFPLLWFGLYPPPQATQLPGAPELPALDWQPSVSRDDYDRAIECIKAYIAGGATYQVNYTMRLRSPFMGDAWALFLNLAQAQRANYAAYLDMGPFALCSSSPELFFRLEENLLTTRPMKGTAGRGRWLADDEAQADWLHHSEKNRAENVMIVDMMRNDLGRIAEVGSVQAPSLFDVERYPTVWQMTSTVTAQSRAPFSQVMSALFPCASITGAPKRRTMQIIAELETTPRRAYTGCIGFYAPGRQAQFNVAIRTVLVDRAAGQAEYGVGGGIVWDSTSAEEYTECLIKARVLSQRRPRFALLESLLWQPGQGYFLLEEHLMRLQEAAVYFQYPLGLPAVQTRLAETAGSLPLTAHKVRLLVEQDGSIVCQAAPLETKPAPLRLGLALQPVDAGSPFLYHKTTQRQVYDQALAACPGCDDVLLWNERRQVTETCTANLVFEIGGKRSTPPVACGLLPGTLRARLLAQGEVQERMLTLDELPDCERLYVINSVRGWREAVLPPPG